MSSPVLQFIRPSEGDAIWYMGSLMTIKTGGDQTGEAFDFIDLQLPVGMNPPPHLHQREDESYYLLDGHITYFCGDTTFLAGPGDFVRLPRGVIHTFRVEGPTPAHALGLYTPAGLRNFFKELGEPAQERTLPPLRPISIETFRRVSAQYGIELFPERKMGE
jgi:mannose-6-phosphate isomerase-like protein (cupin superfamily)